MADIQEFPARTLVPRSVAPRLGRRGFLIAAAGVAGGFLVGRGRGEQTGWTASGPVSPSAAPGLELTGTLNLYSWA